MSVYCTERSLNPTKSKKKGQDLFTRHRTYRIFSHDTPPATLKTQAKSILTLCERSSDDVVIGQHWSSRGGVAVGVGMGYLPRTCSPGPSSGASLVAATHRMVLSDVARSLRPSSPGFAPCLSTHPVLKRLLCLRGTNPSPLRYARRSLPLCLLPSLIKTSSISVMSSSFALCRKWHAR